MNKSTKTEPSDSSDSSSKKKKKRAAPLLAKSKIQLLMKKLEDIDVVKFPKMKYDIETLSKRIKKE